MLFARSESPKVDMRSNLGIPSVASRNVPAVLLFEYAPMVEKSGICRERRADKLKISASLPSLSLFETTHRYNVAGRKEKPISSHTFRAILLTLFSDQRLPRAFPGEPGDAAGEGREGLRVGERLESCEISPFNVEA
jgi:hypothetical protein